jgi:hypothetical protein
MPAGSVGEHPAGELRGHGARGSHGGRGESGGNEGHGGRGSHGWPGGWTAAVAAACAGLALLAGAGLRLFNLRDQVLGGDELHAVRAALSQPLPALLTTYQLADSCIPLTALDRLLLDHGVTLGEWQLRLPVLASGLAALLVLPALVRRRLAPAAWPLFCALVALSPLLVLYSRIARPYMPATLLAFAACMAFESATRPLGEADLSAHAKRGGAATAYVVLGALAVWFHLGAAPMVAAPLLFGAAELALGRLVPRRDRRAHEAAGGRRPVAGRDPEQRRRWLRLGALTAGLAVACALFLVPAYPSLVRLVAAKRQVQEIPAATWWTVLQLQAGTGQRLPALLFWAAALAGAAGLLRRRPRLGSYLLALVAGQALGILLLSPLGLARPQVLDRYLLPVLPVVLLWVAAGLARPWWAGQGSLGRAGQRLGAAGLVLVWALAGPFADPGVRASSFMHHNDMVAFALPRATPPPGGPPRPYLALGGPPGSALVELPWPPVWDFGRSFYVYQEIHELRVLVAPPAGALPIGRLRLRNEVSSEPAALRRNGARYVVVHRHLALEEARLRLSPTGPPPRRMPPLLAAQLAAEGERVAALLAAAWGPPAFADGDVAVWDLRRRRPQLHASAPPP